MSVQRFAVSPSGLAVAGAVGMATMGVMARYSGVDAAVITFYRLGLGALFVALLLALLPGAHWRRPHVLTLVSGALLAGFIVFYVRAMDHTTMANAVLTVYLAPPLAALAGHFIWHERLGRWQAACIGAALLGFATMMEFRVKLSAADLQGLGFAGLALLCYAAFMLLNRHNPDRIPPLQAVFWQLLVGALVMLWVAGPTALAVPVEALPWMLATGLLPGFLALTCTVLAMQRLPTAQFGTLAYSEPVAVILFGWLLFAEILSPLQVTGCLLIIAAGIVQARVSAASTPVEPLLADTEAGKNFAQ
ncbi:DMT family transporter [Parahaliea aestuarii]|uniref:DMT family transporter n=1 Tax=Parahaliea aestuarii TaxID=1852021 RepID=A0A5C8ZXP5_9GAMM|nr:DMT family transporter [Parahaliea aestuarii]TXS92362.1 DMT family transporter [Parahaliea aestuarii]